MERDWRVGLSHVAASDAISGRLVHQSVTGESYSKELRLQVNNSLGLDLTDGRGREVGSEIDISLNRRIS